MHTTTVDSRALGSYPHIDTAVVGEDRLDSPTLAISLRKSYATRRQHGWMRTLLVTNLANGRTVQVRINDRGPAVAGRVVDLSYAAARQLDMVHVGVTRVKIEFLAAPLPGPTLIVRRIS
jgi:Lytic transglycolase